MKLKDLLLETIPATPTPVDPKKLSLKDDLTKVISEFGNSIRDNTNNFNDFMGRHDVDVKDVRPFGKQLKGKINPGVYEIVMGLLY